MKKRCSTTEFQNTCKAVIRFDKLRDRSVKPKIHEYWKTRVRQYLQDRQECFELALISGSDAPESSDSGEYLKVRLYGDLKGKQLMRTLRVDTHADPLGTPYDSTQLYHRQDPDSVMQLFKTSLSAKHVCHICPFEVISASGPSTTAARTLNYDNKPLKESMS